MYSKTSLIRINEPIDSPKRQKGLRKQIIRKNNNTGSTDENK
jgi:hypothetical protein